MVSSTPQPHFTPGKEPVTILQDVGWAPGPVWKGGKSRPHRDLIPYRLARSQSLYRLSYPAHNRNEHQEYFLGGKGGRCVGLETFPPSCAYCLAILEPQPPGIFRPCPGLYKDCFTFTYPCYGAGLNAHSGKNGRNYNGGNPNATTGCHFN